MPPRTVHKGPRKSLRVFLPQPQWLPKDTTPAVTVPGRISYIIPAYNAERTLAEAVRGIFDQTLHPQEIVIVDDGSTDETWQVAQDLARGHGSVIVLQQNNLGPAAARNRAIRAATGDYLIYVDADDLVPPDRTELTLEAFGATGAELVYGQKVRYDLDRRQREGLERAVPPTPQNVVSGCGCGTCAVATRRHLHVDRGVWLDETMAGAEDADLLIQALAAGAPVYCSEAVLCWRRASTESLRHRVDWTALRRYLLVKHRVFLEQWGGQPVRVGAEEEAAIWTRRRQAGLVRAEVGES